MDPALLAIYLAACGAAAATGALFRPGAWYAGLRKPRWTPPNWLFPVAWTLLYLLLAVVAARIAPLPGAERASALWTLQIVLNAVWTPVFFGLHRPRAALVVIVLLWGATAMLLAALWPLDHLAFALAAPYLAWITYAAALNAAVVRLNPRRAASA
ncbi:tryptophan-rich sensory protein TspO [Jannaschia sp. W003]|uniref:tryptophan-rich sensory protein TspO n=1 Tax=Jannaschia sp. W003 TaxID=2867012 RepID=UPI0021A3AED1|nr:TspO/MBR family protein [Jannaschia sp. W003]UWQ21972.1 tryptophan-rich sensory protein [Jannaschia sp. W003]